MNLLAMIDRAGSRKLIPKTPAEREAWLLRRRRGVGASDAPVILGLSKWKTAHELWHDKAGLVPPGEMSEQALWGLLHEPLILEMYAAATGREVHPAPEFVFDQAEPWRYCNPDGVCADRLVQAKQSFLRDGWGKEGTADIPVDYYAQCQHEMGVTGADLCDVPVLFGGNCLRVYTVPYDRAADDRIMEAEEVFWTQVRLRSKPAIDWSHPAALPFLERLHKPAAGATLEGAVGDELWHAVRDYGYATEAARERQEVADAHRAKIVHLMGEHATATFPDGRVVSRLASTGKPLFRVTQKESQSE